MAANSSTAATPSDREIVIKRLLNAPRELVFEAWTDPKHVAQWWGPRGFTTTTHEMDVRPGGVWRFTMRSLFASAAERDKTVEFGAIEGGNQTLDRLEEHLAKM